MKKLLRRIFVSHILVFSGFQAFSQIFSEKNYPRNYFQWPVGATIGIAANFGELRPNHYHMGLDARTERRQNLPIYAAAEGYIAKVKIEPFGFGRCIYLNHPNGLTTLYAHLNDFYPELEKYITEQQYALRQWSVFLDIPPHLFPVKKGEIIAYSGNTGGSQGPHLHFEIRDTKTDKVLNPLLFDLPIRDNIPPDILRVAMYDRRMSTYEQAPRIIALKKINGTYVPVSGNPVINSDRVSFAITAYDRYTGSTNQNGIYRAVLYDNDKPACAFEMDSISYDDTRYLNAHIDYRYKSRGGPYLQHLSRLPGHVNGIYVANVGDGVISLPDQTPHEIRIEVSDAANNISVVKFLVRSSGTVNAASGNTRLPLFEPGSVSIFENDNARLYLKENDIYDSFHFRFNEIAGATSTIFQLHDHTVPVHSYFPASLKGNFPDTSKVVMKYSHGSRTDYSKATFNDGWYTSRFRGLGNFQLLSDNTPPVISPVRRSRWSLAFSIVDNTEELVNFNAWLDGKWLRFSNDKGRTFVYTFDEHCEPGPHVLKIEVEDLVGNRSERTFQFTR